MLVDDIHATITWRSAVAMSKIAVGFGSDYRFIGPFENDYLINI